MEVLGSESCGGWDGRTEVRGGFAVGAAPVCGHLPGVGARSAPKDTPPPSNNDVPKRSTSKVAKSVPPRCDPSAPPSGSGW